MLGIKIHPAYQNTDIDDIKMMRIIDFASEQGLIILTHAGIDIGDTLIGMHLRAVAVPLRIAHPSIGCAHIVCARTRAKYIGGERAHYNEEMA